MYRSILVPLDGSERAEAVVPHVVALAHKFAAQVILLQVVAPFELVRRDLLRGDLSALQVDLVTDVARKQVHAQHEAATHYLEEQVETLHAQGIEAKSTVEEGDPAAAIVHFAKDRGNDLIAMATHGRGGLARLVYGSVADRVLRSAPCPVLLVRSLAHDPGA